MELLGSRDIWTDRKPAQAVSEQSHPKHSSDAVSCEYQTGGMDEKAVRKAALVTLRRAILERLALS
jgi:hypothetical protein